jgi:hypothetical protein
VRLGDYTEAVATVRSSALFFAGAFFDPKTAASATFCLGGFVFPI